MTDRPITFTDEQGNEWVVLMARGWVGKYGDVWSEGPIKHATPSDLALAGYEPTTQALDRLAIEAAIVAEDTRRELEALRAFEDHARNALENGRWEGPAISEGLQLLKAVDEARK